jgi:hypothetical protein
MSQRGQRSQISTKAELIEVVRPPEVWDTRSPLVQLNRMNHDLGQAYWATLLALSVVRDASKRADQPADGRSAFAHRDNSQFRRTWEQFARSFPSNFDGTRLPITAKQVHTSVKHAVAAITEHAIVKSSSLFESFAQCWALNYVLARLEASQRLTAEELALIREFSPLTSRQLPGWPRIVHAIPLLVTELRTISHVRVDPRTGTMADEPLSEQLNALVVISFWRKWRNALVHSSGAVTPAFWDKHADIWAALCAIVPAARLGVGRKLPLNENIYRSVASVHAHAARRMRTILMDASHDRRGHVLAPGPRWPSDRLPPDKMPTQLPAMLIPGDHEPSVKYATGAVEPNVRPPSGRND